MASINDQLVELLKNTAEAHHEAFKHVNGEDPEWPVWYAINMHSDFEAIIDRSVSKDGLADLLERFNQLHPEEAPDQDWSQYYAGRLLNFYTT
jgi:hypothetical protein